MDATYGRLLTPAEMRAGVTLTPAEARARLDERGESISRWSTKLGINPNTTSDLLNKRKKGVRGEAHKAAVLLGLKRGKIMTDHELATAI